MKTILLFCLASVGILTSPSLSNGISQDNFYEELENTIQLINAEYPEDGPGLSYYVELSAGTQEGVTGLADVEWNTPIGSATLIRIGSLSKPVTALAALDLFSSESIDLDVPISEFVPNLPEHMGSVTLRQIMSHTTGLKEHAMGDRILPYIWRPVTPAQMIELEAEIEPSFPAGSKYEYSNFNYVLLAHVIETVTKKSFVEFIDSYLRHHAIEGQFDVPDRITPLRAKFYNQFQGNLSNTPGVDLSHVSAAGALLMSMNGAKRWSDLVLNGDILDTKLVEMAWQPNNLTDGSRSKYGLGFNVGMVCGKRALWHTGSTPGARSAFLLIPETGERILLLSNVYRPNSLYGTMGQIIRSQYYINEDKDWASTSAEECLPNAARNTSSRQR